MKVLIAFPRREAELADALEEELHDRAREHSVFIETRKIITGKEGRMALEGGGFSAILVHEHLPGTERETTPAGGVDFIARLRADNIGTRAALLYSRPHFTPAEFQRLKELKDVTQIAHDADVVAQLVDYALSSKEPKARLDITLDLTQPPQAWKYRISGEKYLPCPLEGFLHLKSDEVSMLLKLSEHVDEEAPAWEDRLELLSRSLWERLVEGQTQFREQLAVALEKSGSIENTRLRFRTVRKHHGVAFEAIRHPGPPSDYWMLGAPVYRSLGLGVQTKAVPLFESDERQRLNCLVVLANAAGTVKYGDKALEYKPIKRGHLEYERLCNVLQRQRDPRVNVQLAGDKEPVTLQSLRKLLTPSASDPTRRWDLVHFVGHTDFVNDRGYFILPRSAKGGARAVPARHVTPLLGNSRFLYLSSCRSASSAFVFRLAERGIASLLGFCMPIRDSLAVEHASRFYEDLFRTRSTEDAFLATRRHFYQTKPESRVWARSLLILQT